MASADVQTKGPPAHLQITPDPTLPLDQSESPSHREVAKCPVPSLGLPLSNFLKEPSANEAEWCLCSGLAWALCLCLGFRNLCDAIPQG